MGRNGAGKTMSLRTIMGLLGKCSGKVTFDGNDLLGRPPHERFHHGLAYVPHKKQNFSRRIFMPRLSQA